MKIQIERNGCRAWLTLPCDEDEMQSAEQSVGITDPTDTTIILRDIDCCITELSVLKGKEYDLDHLNLLARYLDGMFGGEINQYRATLYVTGKTELTDIINLTQNTRNYSLAEPDDTLTKIGRNHYFDLHGCYKTDEESSLHFDKIGRDLIASGQGIETPYGMVFDNGLDYIDFFNGRNIPCYYDREFVFIVTVCHCMNEESLFLPCHEAEIAKAVKRLGASDLSECSVMLEDMQIERDNPIRKLFEEVDMSDLHAINILAAELSDYDKNDFKKLWAVYEYTRAHEDTEIIPTLMALASHIGCFDFASGVTDTERLGEYFIKESGRYDFDAELEDYYLFEQFGEDTLCEQDGMFLDDGYVGIRDDIQLWEILDENGQTMEEMR